jgi:hypothetical protein
MRQYALGLFAVPSKHCTAPEPIRPFGESPAHEGRAAVEGNRIAGRNEGCREISRRERL